MVPVHVVLYVWNTLPLGPHIGNFHFSSLMLISPHLKKSWPSEVGPSSFLCHVSLARHSSNICDDDSTWLLGQHKYPDNSPLHPLFYSPHFEVVISSYYMQQQIISLSDYDVWWKVDFIQQPAMTSSVVGLRRSSKALPKAKLAPKKRPRSLFGGLLPVWSTTDFWIPAKP